MKIGRIPRLVSFTAMINCSLTEYTLPLFREQLICNALARNDDVGSPCNIELVDWSILVCPGLEFQPRVIGWDVW